MTPFSPTAGGTIRWRLMRSPALPAAANMALDEALMTHARERREAVLRVYRWRAPTLSLGRNQRARGLYDETRAAKAGVDIVRRPTGGRAVLHWREVTYSVAAPEGALGDLAAAYRFINELLVAALRRLGVDARIVAPGARELPPGPVPCFETPSAGEIEAGGGKLVGSAQWRDAGALLQHGSILVADDQPLAVELLRESAAPPPPAATLAALLEREPGFDEVADALERALVARCGRAEPLHDDAALAERAAALEPRYRDPDWTWRR